MYSWDVDDEDDEDTMETNFSGVHLIIFLIDASKKMKNSVADEEENLNCIQTSLKCAHATIKNKVMNSPRDCIGVVTFGNNPKQTQETQFQSLRQVLSLSMPSSETILMMEEFTDCAAGAEVFEEQFGSGDDSNINEALWHCQTMFSSYSGKVGMKTIILMTNNPSPHQGNPKLDQLARKKAQDLHNTNIYLDVVPVCPNNSEQFAMETFYSDLIKLADDTAPLSTTHISELADIVVRRTSVKRSNGKYMLDIGGTMIGVASYNLVSKKGKPTKQKLASDTNEQLVSRRNWVHPISGAKLLPSDMKRSIKYGDKNIKFTEDEHKNMNNVGGNESNLKLCGFKALSTLSMAKYIRSAHFLYPQDSTVEGSKAPFAALLESCLKKQVYAVCKFKSRPTSGVSYVGLVPQKEEKDEYGVQVYPPGFHVIYLKFLDDTRQVPLVKMNEECSEEAVNSAKDIIMKLKLKRFVPVENCAIQTCYSMIEAHALNRDTVTKPEDETVPDYERMERKVGAKSKLFTSQVYDDGYDPEAPPKKVSKTSTTKEKSNNGPDISIDMEAEVKNKTVSKLTVDTLKSWCKSQGIAVTGKKKADLVETVTQYYS